MSHSVPAGAVAALLLPVLGAFAADIHVPGDAPTIQQAVDAAVPGDRVLVAPGHYLENLDFHGHSVEVVATDGPSATILDAGGAGHTVSFHTGETDEARLTGFTLQNGHATDAGGGVYISGASPHVDGNLIRANQACNGGGIAVVDSGRPRISGNRIQHNAATCDGGYGGGVYMSTRELAVVENNAIDQNQATFGGGLALNAPLFAKPVVTRNVFTSNSASQNGGALYVLASHGRILENLIVGNDAALGGGIYVMAPDHFHHPILVNDTIADNAGGDVYILARIRATVGMVNTIVRTSQGAHSVVCDVDRRDEVQVETSLISSTNGATVEGVCLYTSPLLTDDPQFQAGGDAHAYWLRSTSPAVDAGIAVRGMRVDLSGAPRDSGAAIDLGAFEYRQP